MAWNLTSYEGSNDDYENVGTGGGRAQSFQLSSNSTVSSVGIYGSKGNGASGTFKLSIVSTLGGTELATTGTVNTSTLSAYGSPAWNAVNLSGSVSLNASTTYYLVLTALSGSASDEVRWSVDSTSPSYSSGSSWAFSGSWAQQSTRDRNFRITGIVPYTITATQGGYTLSGQNAILTKGKTLTAVYGSYTLSGQTAITKSNRNITAGQGGYTLFGQDSLFKVALSMPLSVGNFVVSYNDANLAWTTKWTFDTEASAGSPTFDARPVNSLYGTAIYGLSYYGYTNSYAFDSEKGSSNYSFDNEA